MDFGRRSEERRDGKMKGKGEAIMIEFLYVYMLVYSICKLKMNAIFMYHEHIVIKRNEKIVIMFFLL